METAQEKERELARKEELLDELREAEHEIALKRKRIRLATSMAEIEFMSVPKKRNTEPKKRGPILRDNSSSYDEDVF